jgi:hypothetical protein
VFKLRLYISIASKPCITQENDYDGVDPPRYVLPRDEEVEVGGNEPKPG